MISKNEYNKIHIWLRKTYGNATCCEEENCLKRSNNFGWALIKGKTYEYKRDNFKMLCKSCHTKYDFTEETVIKIRKALIGRKHSEKTKLKMRNIAIKNKCVPPRLTPEQLEQCKLRMKENKFGFKKGHIPWNKKRMERVCQICNKIFFTNLYTVKSGKGKYCSKKCIGASRRGLPSWNKNVPCDEATKMKISETYRIKNLKRSWGTRWIIRR